VADEPPEVRLDGEGNPIDDQPLIERTIDQWPLALVLLGLAAGLVVLSFFEFRVGSVILGVAIIFGGALRLVLPRERAGLLAIRGRPIDLVTMFGLGIALTTVAVLVPPAR
jgi:succinate-acetate transporter protein